MGLYEAKFRSAFRESAKYFRSSFIPSKFFSAFQSYCPRSSVVLLSHDSRSTLVWLDGRKKNWSSKDAQTRICKSTPTTLSVLSIQTGVWHHPPQRVPFGANVHVCTCPDFFLQSSGNWFDMLSYGSKTTDKREQYRWSAVKKIERAHSFFSWQIKSEPSTLCKNSSIFLKEMLSTNSFSLQKFKNNFLLSFLFPYVTTSGNVPYYDNRSHLTKREEIVLYRFLILSLELDF